MAEWDPDSLELVLDLPELEPRSATVRRTRALVRMLRTRRTEEVTPTTPRLRPPDLHLVAPRGARLLPRRHTSRTCTTAGACRARAMLPARASTVTRRLTTRARTEAARTPTLNSSSTTLNSNNNCKLRTDNRARSCSTPVRRPTRPSSSSSSRNNCTQRRRPTRVESLTTNSINRWGSDGAGGASSYEPQEHLRGPSPPAALVPGAVSSPAPSHRSIPQLGAMQFEQPQPPMPMPGSGSSEYGGQQPLRVVNDGGEDPYGGMDDAGGNAYHYQQQQQYYGQH